MNIYSIPPLISSAIFAFLGGFVFLKNKKSSLNITFSYFCLATFWWQFSWFILFNVKDNDFLASILVKVGYTGITFIALTMLNFVLILLEWKKYLKYIYLSYWAAFVLLFFLWGTNYYINGFYRYYFGYYPKANFIHVIHLIHQLLLGGLPIYIILGFSVRRFKNNPVKYSQVKYLFIAFLIYLPSAIDYLTNYGFEFYPIGFIFILITASILAYTIIRYKLMEIDTVIHRTLLWVLTSAAVLIPIGGLLYFVRHWLESLSLSQLTLAVTALFYLFLYYFKVMQPKIDHFFRRRKYDYYKVLADIPQRIGSELNLKHITVKLFKELQETLYIRNSLLLVKQEEYLEVGSCGYNRLSEEDASQRKEALLNLNSPLLPWLSQHQKALEREQVEVDPQYLPIKEEGLAFFKQHQLEVVIPIIMENKVNAILGIGKKDNLKSFTIKDIELLEGIGRQIGITIDNALHHEDIVEKERLAEELRLGRDIQMNLLPKELPSIPTLSVDGLMLPAQEIGGDYYDFITLPKEDELAIVIGDVSGKGVAAGLLMAMAKTAIHTLSQESRSPKEVLLRTNSILYSHIGGQKFMTMLYFKYNPQDKTLTYSSAGHEHILIYHSSTATVESIISGGFMLGMLADIEAYLEEHKLKLSPKDKVLLYTDGVTDAENTKGERYTLDRLKDSFKTNSNKAPFEMIHAIKTEVYTFIGQQPQYDDITLVGMETGE